MASACRAASCTEPPEAGRLVTLHAHSRVTFMPISDVRSMQGLQRPLGAHLAMSAAAAAPSSEGSAARGAGCIGLRSEAGPAWACAGLTPVRRQLTHQL